MQIWPAIDLLQGQAVRLTKGDYDKVKVYFENPAQILAFFEKAGARRLHVVDLDGARDGTLSNQKTITKLLENSHLQIEVGGGIRTSERVKLYLDLGVDRVILGTAAVEDPVFLRQMVDRYGKRIVVGVDAARGQVAVQGWRKVTDIDALSFCLQLQRQGVSTVIVTDISKDGALQGTNLAWYRQLAQELSIEVIASGGVTYSNEILELKEAGVAGAIIGKALYEGILDLREVLQTGGDLC